MAIGSTTLMRNGSMMVRIQRSPARGWNARDLQVFRRDLAARALLSRAAVPDRRKTRDSAPSQSLMQSRGRL
jgi:hypothetical protein